MAAVNLSSSQCAAAEAQVEQVGIEAPTSVADTHAGCVQQPGVRGSR